MPSAIPLISPSRSRDVAESLLGDYSGTIIRDSYAACEQLDSSETLAGCLRLHADGWASRRYVDPAGRLLVHFIALEYCISLDETLEKRRDAHSPAFHNLKIIFGIAPKHVKAVSMTMPEAFARVELLESYSRREPREISVQELRSISVQPGAPYFLLRFHPAR